MQITIYQLLALLDGYFPYTPDLLGSLCNISFIPAFTLQTFNNFRAEF